MTAKENEGLARWADAWPDALAFAAGLAVAWYAGWETKDLVWSLWLSSFVVGYTMIIWMIFAPALLIGRAAYQNQTIRINNKEVPISSISRLAYLGIALFMLAFFTVHFGMFHFVHSVFLSMFFPLTAGERPQMPGLAFYFHVVRDYWIFLPIAFLAERQAFRLPETTVPGTPAAAASGKVRKSGKDGMMAPYKNVIRMHMLIFFFAAAHFAKLENFLVYTVVYAAYFFPWRLLKRDKDLT